MQPRASLESVTRFSLVQTCLRSWGQVFKRWFRGADLHLVCFSLQERRSIFWSAWERGHGERVWELLALHFLALVELLRDPAPFSSWWQNVALSQWSCPTVFQEQGTRLSLRLGTLGSIHREPEKGLWPSSGGPWQQGWESLRAESIQEETRQRGRLWK